MGKVLNANEQWRRKIAGEHLANNVKKNPAKIKGVMNSLEAEYAAYLQLKKLAGDILFYIYEPFPLVLAKNTTYTPDFFVITKCGKIEMHEVKGFWRQSGRIKIKVASELNPWFKFRSVQKKSGMWKFEEFTSSQSISL